MSRLGCCLIDRSRLTLLLGLKVLVTTVVTILLVNIFRCVDLMAFRFSRMVELVAMEGIRFRVD